MNTGFLVRAIGAARFQGFRSLSPHQPAIDRNHCSGHIIRQIRRKELDHLGTILYRSEPPKCDQLGPVAIALAATRNNRLHDPPGGDDPRSNAVGGDAVRAEILRQITRVMRDRRLRGTVMRVAAVGGRRQAGDCYGVAPGRLI